MKPICIPCQRFFRPVKSGFYFLEGFPQGAARPGKSDADRWKPYKLWAGDKWRCEGCGAEIISGTGTRPISEHFESEFATLVESCGAEYQVNDC